MHVHSFLLGCPPPLFLLRPPTKRPQIWFSSLTKKNLKRRVCETYTREHIKSTKRLRDHRGFHREMVLKAATCQLKCTSPLNTRDQIN